MNGSIKFSPRNITIISITEEHMITAQNIIVRLKDLLLSIFTISILQTVYLALEQAFSLQLQAFLNQRLKEMEDDTDILSSNQVKMLTFYIVGINCLCIKVKPHIKEPLT